MTRRNFLRIAAASACGLLVPFAAQATDMGVDLHNGVRQLDLLRPATGERLSLAYLNNGVWVPGAFSQLCWLLRDVHAQQHVRMDLQLIAILDWTQRYLASYGHTGPLHILSGYRTPQTNRSTEGASKNSQHLYGKAVDFYVPGLSTEYLGKLMSWLSQGGVGVYGKNGFVHVDTGQVRHWRAPN